ncbi:hypothetical protein [Sporolactobacillus laevolacticus]|uniref:hypothetical protein n=1 Tax=Sporolactobacillus laevolacticus TaxID=33018 RepID=UPI0025B3BE9C|nr:hypothetical protein [Sporolactobacillus laevolacticus]MDN3956208.1 hypothetical protein [Sporolactobacillus laevolacticus]
MVSKNKMENLSKQVYILAVTTDDFINEDLNKLIVEYNELKAKKKENNQFIEKLLSSGYLTDVKSIKEDAYANYRQYKDQFKGKKKTQEQKDKIKELSAIYKEKEDCHKRHRTEIQNKRKDINDQIKEKLNEIIRLQYTLDNESIFDDQEKVKSVAQVSLFDSAFTRALKLKQNETTLDVVEVSNAWFPMMRSLILNGFMFNGQEYEYYASGAGQIRKKRAVFVLKSLFHDENEKPTDTLNKLTCGLSWNDINKYKDKDGNIGINPNKYNAYMALNNTATVPWEYFNIKRAIVVDDFETMVHGKVDYINPKTYGITPNHEMDVPVPHMDGAGLITPYGRMGSHRCFQVRLPFFKGLLIPFDFKAFAKKKGITEIKDIYGDSHEIKNVDVIFTKSQFKMSAYWHKWKTYQDAFNTYRCESAKFNFEEENHGVKLSYQFLQTLTDLKENEIETIGKRTFDEIKNIGSDRATMLKHLKADSSNQNKNEFEEALSIYPELLKDAYTKKQIKDAKAKMVNNAKCGKLEVDGSFLFVLPDVYAFCEWLFSDDDYKIKVANNEMVPLGLLTGNQVHCKVFKNEQELDLLRSPHLYKEHAVRTNVTKKEFDGWFIAKNAIYTSSHDLISKILMFDVDGDKLYAVSDQTIVNAAKRNMQGVNPLYYEMSKAKPQKLTLESIADNLELAYKANIGKYSDAITKILNSKSINWDVIKWLVMENNFEIDRAKTNFMVKRPTKEIRDTIKQAISGKMPYFIQFARLKEERKKVGDRLIVKKITPDTEEISEKLDNNSTLNKIVKLVPTDNVKFSAVPGTFEVRYLMSKKLKDGQL